MSKPTQCIVPECPNPVHAKGYCRRHYAQVWRRGVISDPAHEFEDLYRRREQTSRTERLQTLEQELQKAEQSYRVVVGLAGRIKWRRQIEAIQVELRNLLERPRAAEVAEVVDAAVAEEAVVASSASG